MRDAKRVMLRRPEADIAHAEGGLGRAIRREVEAEPSTTSWEKVQQLRHF